ncbi:P60-like protein [Marasmius fiardii PR-910]|nr:P60-like protein [Marasmius fiardii PR-910]
MAKEKTKSSKPTSKPKNLKSSIGAPSQRSQPSRKGKRAWRKNVDLDDLEEGLEEIREEERVHGTALHKLADNELFQIDTEGDEKIRQSLPKFSTSQLTSAKILAQRSAIPAVYSRHNSTNAASKRKAVSYADKERLLRQAKKPRKGPLNSIMDSRSDLWGGATGLTEAVKNSGHYDPWAMNETSTSKETPPDNTNTNTNTNTNKGEAEKDDFRTEVLKTLHPLPPKPPKHASSLDLSDPRTHIQLPAVPLPHAGMSYNPPVAAHQELLLQAHSAEQKKEKEADKLKEVKERIEKARALEEVGELEARPGMIVDQPGDDDEEEEQTPSREVITIKMPERKTKAQRRKEARRLEEKRILAGRAAKKRMMSVLNNVNARNLRKSMRPSTEELVARRKASLAAKLKNGMAGRRMGKYKVPEGHIDVQLGEELSENLRGLKVEGNLFRDRFFNLQQRALIEPRIPVLPKKRRNKIVEYEKHAWKRFDKIQERL